MEHEISVPIQEGDTVTFVCKVGGNPEPRLVFYKDNKRLRTNENIFIGKNKKWVSTVQPLLDNAPNYLVGALFKRDKKAKTKYKMQNLHSKNRCNQIDFTF